MKGDDQSEAAGPAEGPSPPSPARQSLWTQGLPARFPDCLDPAGLKVHDRLGSPGDLPIGSQQRDGEVAFVKAGDQNIDFIA